MNTRDPLEHVVARGAIQIQTTSPTQQATLPKIAADEAGNVLAVWNQSVSSTADVYAARFVAGGAWNTSAVISAANGAGSVSLGMNAKGEAVAVWLQTDASLFSDVWASSFAPSGGWKAAAQLEPANVGKGQAFVPQVAVSASGTAMAVWRRRSGTRFDIWGNVSK